MRSAGKRGCRSINDQSLQLTESKYSLGNIQITQIAKILVVPPQGSKEEMKGETILPFLKPRFTVYHILAKDKVPPGKTEKQSEGNSRKSILLDKECHWGNYMNYIHFRIGILWLIKPGFSTSARLALSWEPVLCIAGCLAVATRGQQHTPLGPSWCTQECPDLANSMHAYIYPSNESPCSRYPVRF